MGLGANTISLMRIILVLTILSKLLDNEWISDNEGIKS